MKWRNVGLYGTAAGGWFAAVLITRPFAGDLAALVGGFLAVVVVLGLAAVLA